MSRRLRLVAALMTILLAATLAVVPASARKKRKKPKPPSPSVVIYHVVYAGAGTYSYKENSTDGSGGHDFVDSSYHWHADYPYVFVQRKSGAMIGAPTVMKGSSGGGDWTIDFKSGSSDGQGDCKSAGGLALASFGGIQGTVQRSGAVVLTAAPGMGDFTTTGGSSGSDGCATTDFWHSYPVSFSHIGSSDGQEIDPLTAFIHLSKRDLSAGKIVIPVSNHSLAAPSLSLPPDCSGGSSAVTCKQSFQWTGTVTLTKVMTGKSMR